MQTEMGTELEVLLGARALLQRKFVSSRVERPAGAAADQLSRKGGRPRRMRTIASSHKRQAAASNRQSAGRTVRLQPVVDQNVISPENLSSRAVRIVCGCSQVPSGNECVVVGQHRAGVQRVVEVDADHRPRAAEPQDLATRKSSWLIRSPYIFPGSRRLIVTLRGCLPALGRAPARSPSSARRSWPRAARPACSGTRR